MNIRPIPVLVGPTGVGKTAVGIELARRCGAEIISADSRQIYRHMDIGTAKPATNEQAAVPHHLIDIVDPDVRFSAGEYGRRARHAVKELADRGVPALVVGGAGLYVKALAGGLFDAPAIPPTLRRRLTDAYRKVSTAALHQRLIKVDPASAARIHANDRQRIERALEVHDATGTSLTSWFERTDRNARSGCLRLDLIGLRRDRNMLYRRIDRRVDKMMESGFEEEVRGLMNRGYGTATHGLSTFGYAEILRYILGELNACSAIECIRQRTRQYAKRQMTWFRKTDGIRWFTVEDGEDPCHTCDRIMRSFPNLLMQ